MLYCSAVCRRGANNESTFNKKALKNIFRVHHIRFIISLLQVKMPGGDQRPGDVIFYFIMAMIIFIGVLLLMCASYDWCHEFFLTCTVTTGTSYPVNQVDNSMQPPGLMSLRPEERQKVFKRILARKVCKREFQ